MGAGEILLHAIDREGTYTGFDLNLIQQVVAAVKIPVIALGGARHAADAPRLCGDRDYRVSRVPRQHVPLPLLAGRAPLLAHPTL